jgi:AraC-like DNA-binding protein
LHEFGSQLFIILVHGGIAQGLFVVLLLNHKRVLKSRANIFLSILIVAMTFSITHIFYAGSVIGHISTHMYSPGDPTFLLIAPSLWFYAEELTGQRVRFTRALLLHFAPFLLIVTVSLTSSSLHAETFFTMVGPHLRLMNILFWILVVAQFSCYLYFIQHKWLAYQKLMRQEVSNTENINISWIRFFLVVFLIVNLFFLFSLFAAIHLEGSKHWLQKATAGVFSVSVFALSFKSILQRDIFNTIVIEKPADITDAGPVVKPDPALIDKVITHMKETKPYLDAELTLSTLAKNLSMSRSQLSQLINDGMNENFYDFVNKYRVEEVKRLMTDPAAKNFNLLGIALEAGFKSKSTFNLIFKRFTGLTPTEYKKNISA